MKSVFVSLILLVANSDITELSAPADQILKSLPGVDSVEVVPAKAERKRRVIHLLNWHFVPKEQFKADLNSQRDEPLTEDELDERYEQFRDDVEAVQIEQMNLLRVLIKKHGLQELYCEGLAVKEVGKYRKLLKTLKTTRKAVQTGDSPLDRFIQYEFRSDLLMIGAAGQLLMSGELRDVLPTETVESLKAGAPFDANGDIVLDEKQIEEREDVIVEHLFKGGPVSVIILGGAHDLSNNLSDDSEYIRIETKAYRDQMATDETGLVAEPGRNDSQIQVLTEDETTIIDITSEFGIDKATVHRTRPNWPKMTLVRLHLGGLESFKAIRNEVGVEWSVSSTGDHDLLTSLTKGKRTTAFTKESQYFTEVRIVGGSEDIPLKDGHFEVPLPAKLFDGNPKSITLQWIDFYRN